MVATGLFAIAWIPLRLAQDARQYALVTLFASLVLYTALLYLERQKLGYLVAHTAAIAAAAYTHLFGLIAPAGIILGLLICPRLVKQLGWKWAISVAAAVVLWLPWASVLLQRGARLDLRGSPLLQGSYGDRA